MEIGNNERSYSSLYGVWGIFKVPDSSFTIKYFSSKVHSKDKATATILNELKPMRERVRPENLKDMKSLLQRDLDDKRIATELIPYLQGKKEIAFFPGVLAVLSPKDFFILEKNIQYPKFTTSETEKRIKTSYDENWILEIIKVDKKDEPSAIAELRIDLSSTVIVVLDGQHRANSFKFVSGQFDTSANKIYSTFYSELTPTANYESELPITFIWFESNDQPVKANIISRELFIDVNNNAKRISRAREILLDDIDPIAVLTGLFYSFIARNIGFKHGELSMIHSDFDIPEDIAYSKMNILSLTSPEIIFDIVDRLFFSSHRYLDLDKYEVSRDRKNNELDKIKQYLPKFTENIQYNIIEDSEKESLAYNNQNELEIKEEFEKVLNPIIYRLLSELNISKIHLDVCKEINEKYNQNLTEEHLKIWNTVFCGGEGLYYTFNSYENVKVKSVLEVIRAIESDFNKLRYSKISNSISFSLIQRAYKTFRSKAFQIGLIAAFKSYYELENMEVNPITINTCLNEFIERLNTKTVENWINILTILKSEIITTEALDPKKWPAMHKIILRVVAKPEQFYNIKENYAYSPEVIIFKNKVMKHLQDTLNKGIHVDNAIHINRSTLLSWKTNILSEIESIYSQCNLSVFEDIDWESILIGSVKDFEKKKKITISSIPDDRSEEEDDEDEIEEI